MTKDLYSSLDFTDEDLKDRVIKKIQSKKQLRDSFKEDFKNKTRIDMGRVTKKRHDVFVELQNDISEQERKLNIYKNTKTAKEAFENILKEDRLRFLPSYCEYASTHVFEEVNKFQKHANLQHLAISLTNSVRNDLPMIHVHFLDPQWHMTANSRTYFVVRGQKTPFSPTDLKRLVPVTQEEIKEQTQMVQSAIDAATSSADRKFQVKKSIWRSAKKQQKMEKRAQFEAQKAEELLSKNFEKLIKLTEDRAKIKTKEELDKEKEQIADEMNRVANFLDRLGYAVEMSKENE